MTLRARGVAVFALVALAEGRAAAEPQVDGDGVHREVVHEWYGPSVAAPYAIGYAAAALGYVMDDADAAAVRVGAKLVTGAGIITAVLGPPVTHWSFDNSAGGFISLGGQLGLGGGGALVGGIASGGTLDGIALGLAIGHATWAVADVALVAHRRRVPFIHAPRTAHRRSPAMSPVAWAVPGGGILGIAVAH